MSHMKMESTNGEIEIQLEVKSDGAVETHFNSHLLKDALVHLIEEAQIDFWLKHEDELQPDEFWASILGAVARSYRASLDVPLEENVSNAAVLRELINGLEGEEYL